MYLSNLSRVYIKTWFVCVSSAKWHVTLQGALNQLEPKKFFGLFWAILAIGGIFWKIYTWWLWGGDISGIWSENGNSLNRTYRVWRWLLTYDLVQLVMMESDSFTIVYLIVYFGRFQVDFRISHRMKNIASFQASLLSSLAPGTENSPALVILQYQSQQNRTNWHHLLGFMPSRSISAFTTPMPANRSQVELLPLL